MYQPVYSTLSHVVNKDNGRVKLKAMSMVRVGSNDEEDEQAKATAMRMVRASDGDKEDGQPKAVNDEDGRGRQQ